MAVVTRLILDVLKARQPNALEFASQLADLGADYEVNLLVQEVDDKTESTIVTIYGDTLDFSAITKSIEKMGGSIHSIDEVDVKSDTESDTSAQ